MRTAHLKTTLFFQVQHLVKYFRKPLRTHVVNLKLTHRINEFAGCLRFVRIFNDLIGVYHKPFKFYLVSLLAFSSFLAQVRTIWWNVTPRGANFCENLPCFTSSTLLRFAALQRRSSLQFVLRRDVPDGSGIICDEHFRQAVIHGELSTTLHKT